MNQYKFETRQLHAGQEMPDPTTGARAVPIYQSAAYVFKDCKEAENRFSLKEVGPIYSRLTNPTQDAFEQRITSLENGFASLAVASGSAATSYAIQTLAKAGEHIVSSKSIYGGTYNLLDQTLPAYGITATFVDCFDLNEIENAIQENTKAIFIESLSNPHSYVYDIESIAEIAHKHDIPLVVDNTLATPYLIRPIEYGADIVIHSATKYIGGNGASLGGVIVDSGNFNYLKSGKFPDLVNACESYHGLSFAKDCGRAAFITKARAVLLRDLGACLSPFHSFFFLQGLETLSLRMERHVENSLKVVDFLKKQKKVIKVNHPSVALDDNQQKLYRKYLPHGGGTIFTFDIDGNEADAKKFIDNLTLFSLLANVGDVKSLVIHPASTTHSQLSKGVLKEQNITESTIRLSIGTEHIDDIIGDLSKAFTTL